MKKLSLITLLLAFASTSALACGGPGKSAHLADKLGLDDTQTEQVMAILKEQRSKTHETLQSLREQGVTPRSEEAQAQREAIRSETHERLSTVLTAEQLTEFEQMHDQKRHRMRKHRIDQDEATI